MPLADLNLAQTWRQMYDFSAEPDGHPATRTQVRVGYLRCVGLPIARRQIQQIVSAFGWSTAPAPSILVFSCGFGWHIEALKELAQFANTTIIGTETSSYISTAKTQTETADIDTAVTAAGLNPGASDGLAIKNRLLSGDGWNGARSKLSASIHNEAMANNASRGRIKTALNEQAFVTLSIDALHLYTDAEITTAASRISQIDTAGEFYHLVTPLRESGQAAGLNWKTPTGWQALLPTHQFTFNENS